MDLENIWGNTVPWKYDVSRKSNLKSSTYQFKKTLKNRWINVNNRIA